MSRFRNLAPVFSRGILVYDGDSREMSDGTLARNFREAAAEAIRGAG